MLRNWPVRSSLRVPNRMSKPPRAPQSKRLSHTPVEDCSLIQSELDKNKSGPHVEMEANPAAENMSNSLGETNDSLDAAQTQSEETPQSDDSKALPSGKIFGRTFLDDENGEDTHTGHDIHKLVNLFTDASKVLRNPARCGAFLGYLFTNSRDPNPMLFYLVTTYYRLICEKSDDSTKEQQRWALEIYFTFLHEKSPLCVQLSSDVLSATMVNIQSNVNANIFYVAALSILPQIQEQLDKLSRAIQLGVDTWKASICANLLVMRSRDDEMKIFNHCLIPRMVILLQKLKIHVQANPTDMANFHPQSPGSVNKIYSTEEAEGIALSLCTIHQYYSHPGVGMKASTMKSGLLSRSSENLPQRNSFSGDTTKVDDTPHISSTLNKAVWTKMPTFCYKRKQKSLGGGIFGNRKSKHREKNHLLYERNPVINSECIVCGRLFLGLNPLGLSCNNCDLWVHPECKTNIPHTCTKEGRKLTQFQLSASMSSPNNSLRSNNTTSQPTTPRASMVVDADAEVVLTTLDNICDEDVSSSLHDGHSLSASNIPVHANQPGPDISNSRNVNRSVSVREQGNTRRIHRIRHRREFTDGESKTPPSRNESQCISNVNDPSMTDTVAELIPNDWSEDLEMIAEESFEAGSELRREFPEYVVSEKDSKNENYIRMLCLLEFHQKIRFIVRHLKQYDYLLLRNWPQEHKTLLEELCLDRIPHLIELFRSLVSTINATKTAKGYERMAEAVLAWLTDNSKKNLKTWDQHSQALSCSNLLDCVGKVVREYGQRNPDLQPILKMNYKKINLIEGLKQMRILYFNLPLIANNIVKDLSKKTKSFKDEAKVWEKIYSHLTSLPQTIDDVCMPLVRRINTGQITSNLDKKDSIFRYNNYMVAPFHEMLISFPRTLFRHWVVAHAEIAVDKLTVSSVNKVNHDYIRERTEMVAILMHNSLLFLTKESEKYTLRTYKATREHAGGSANAERSGGQMGNDRMSYVSSNLTGSNQAAAGTLSSTASIAATGSLGERSGGGGGGISRVVPIFSLHNMYTSCGEKFGGEHLLNIISMDPTVLVRVLFKHEAQRLHWFNLLREHSRVATKPLPAPPTTQHQTPNQELEQRQLKKSTCFPRGVARKSSATLPPSSLLKVSIAPPVRKPKPPVCDVNQLHVRKFIVKKLSGSIENLRISPEKRIRANMNEYERINQQLRESLWEMMGLAENEFNEKCRRSSLGHVRDWKDLLILQNELTFKWLNYVTQSTLTTIQKVNWSEGRVKSMDYLYKRFKGCIAQNYQINTPKRSSFSSIHSFDFDATQSPTESLTASTPNLFDTGNSNIFMNRKSATLTAPDTSSTATTGVQLENMDEDRSKDLRQLIKEMTFAINTFNKLNKDGITGQNPLHTAYSESDLRMPEHDDDASDSQHSSADEDDDDDDDDDDDNDDDAEEEDNAVRTLRSDDDQTGVENGNGGEQNGVDSGVVAEAAVNDSQSCSNEQDNSDSQPLNIGSETDHSYDPGQHSFPQWSDDHTTSTAETSDNFEASTPRLISRSTDSPSIQSETSHSSNQISVNRNDSLKSTTSSGFIGSGEE